MSRHEACLTALITFMQHARAVRNDMRGLVCSACCSMVCKYAMVQWQMGDLHSESCPGRSNMSLQYTKAVFKQRHVHSRLQTLLGVAYPGLTEITNSSHQAHTCISRSLPEKSLRPTKNSFCVLKPCSCCVQAVPVALLPTWGTVQSAIMHLVRPHSAH